MEIQHAKRASFSLLAGQEGDCTLMSPEIPGTEQFLRAAPGKGGGGKPSGEEAPGGSESKKPEAPDASGQGRPEDDPRSITSPDSPLTGDTGNTELGQTDLGASGTGAEDPMANGDGERE